MSSGTTYGIFAAGRLCPHKNEKIKKTQKDLASQEMRKHQENLKFGWRHSPAPSSPQKLNLGSSSQKTRKSRYQTLLPLPTFTTLPQPSSPQKLNLGSSSQKTRKSRYQTLLPLSTFTRFPHPVPNIPPRTVGQCNEGIFLVNFESTHHINALFSETYLGPYQTYMMELFAKQ